MLEYATVVKITAQLYVTSVTCRSHLKFTANVGVLTWDNSQRTIPVYVHMC